MTMALTAELVAKVQRIEPDDGPHPELQEMDDADFHQYTERLLEELGNFPLRVFAYGSLIWKPEFEVLHQHHAILNGWHRSFCMQIDRWRGTRALPGLMMALDQGGSCEGVVYDLSEEKRFDQLEKLLFREMTYKPSTNTPLWLNVETKKGVFKALAFVASQSGHSYRGNLPLTEVAKILAQAAGHWGSGSEYLYHTVSHLEQLGIRDENLWELQKLVANEILNLR